MTESRKPELVVYIIEVVIPAKAGIYTITP